MSNELTLFPEMPLQPDQLDCYTGLPYECISRIEQHAIKIYDIADRASMEIGAELIAVRAEYRHNKHGGFERWIEKRLQWERTKAYRTIWRYERFGTVADPQQLDISPWPQTLLSQPGVPQEATDEAIQLARCGVKITTAKAEEIIEKHTQRIKDLESDNEKLQGKLNLLESEQEDERKAMQHKIDDLKQRIADYEEEKDHIAQQIDENETTITHLKEEIAKKSEAQCIEVEVEKFVTPPEVKAEIEEMNKKIAALQETQQKLQQESQAKATQVRSLTLERDKFARDAEMFQKSAHQNLIAQEQERRESEIRDNSRKVEHIIKKALEDARDRFPTSLDAKEAYGSDDWDRIARTKMRLVRFIQEIDDLSNSQTNQFIDVTQQKETRYIDSSFTFVDAG